MKIFLLALLVAVSAASPIPDDDNAGGPVDVIVNGVPEGQALEISDIIDIKVHEHVDGVLTSATNVLYPYSAAGIAEAALAAAESAAPEPVLLPSPAVPEIIPSPVIVVPEAIVPEPVVLPQPILPEVVVPAPVLLPQPAVPEVVIPEPVLLPQPVLPEVVVPEPVLLPQPAVPEVVIPEPVVLPEPVQPEIVPEPVGQAPLPAPQIPQGEVYNDGMVQVTVNTPQQEGVIATLQSWLNVVFNYFGNNVQTTQQIL